MDELENTNASNFNLLKDDELIHEDYLPPKNNVINIEKLDAFFQYTEMVEDILKKQSDLSDLYLINRKASGNFANDYIPEAHLKSYSIDKLSEFPPEQFSNDPDLRIKHGFVPEINRCWFYHQKTVYFWLFNDPKNVYSCYPIDETINFVFAIPLQKDINDRISLLLIFTAQDRIYVFYSIIQYDHIAELNDFHVNISARIEIKNLNNLFTCCCYNDSGRAFLGSEDGHIYEIKYEVHEGTLISCRLINVTAPSILSIIPSIVSNLLAYSSIKQIVIDDHENVLYALCVNNDIDIYKLEGSFDKLSKIDHLKFTNIINQCSSFFPKNFSGRAQSIIKICAVPDTESTFIQLIAITNNGFRIYISSLPGDINSQVTYSDLKYRCVHFRQPPFDESVLQSMTTCSAHLSHENCIISIPYNHAYRVYCLSRTLRCNNDLFQENLTIYSSKEPVVDISTSLIHSLFNPIPYLIKKCYNPKSRSFILTQNLLPTPKFIGLLNPTECLKISYFKSYELLSSIIQTTNFIASQEFATYISRSTDIEFNCACFTLLGKSDSFLKNLYDQILKQIWENSYIYEVTITKNAIYKRSLFKNNENTNPNTDLITLHSDLPPLKLLRKYGLLKNKRLSFVFYTLLLHSYNYLMPIWNSRVLFKNENTDKWDISINLQDCKHLRVRLEELLLCVLRVLKHYKKFINSPLFNELYLKSDSDFFDFSQDIILVENLENMIQLTYQWLHIWSGVCVVDYFDFFQKALIFEQLKTLTYADLIFKNSNFTDKIIWKYLSYISYQPNNLQFFCNQWAKDAALYFLAEYQQIVTANNYLLDAQRAQSPEIRRKHLSASLHVYSALPKSLDLKWISQGLMQMCYHPNAITLCLLSFKNWLQTELNANPDQILFARSIRIQIANIIFLILNNSLQNYEYICNNQHSKNPESQNPEKKLEFFANNLKFSIIAALSSNDDKLLSCDTFDWVIHNGYSYLLSECTSPFLVEYLKDVNFNELSRHELKKAKCLYDIYEKNKNFALAADQLFRIATAHLTMTSPDFIDEKFNIDDRVDYLHISLVHLSVCPQNNETIILTREIKKKIELAEIQKHILSEIHYSIESNSHILEQPENITELRRLKLSENALTNNFIAEDLILQEIVIPCKLATSYLILVKKLGSKYIDEPYLIKTWIHLLNLVLQARSNADSESTKNEAINPFKDLLVDYGTVSYCFPIDKLLFTFECKIANFSVGHLWLPELLANANVITVEEYARKMQTIISELFQNDLEKQSIIDVLFYMIESYISIFTFVLQDINKHNFAKEVEVFAGYIEQKLRTSVLRNIDVISLNDKIKRIRDEILNFYQRISSQS